jgi:hypothetical protein
MSRKNSTWLDVLHTLVQFLGFICAVWLCRFGIAKILVWMTRA